MSDQEQKIEKRKGCRDEIIIGLLILAVLAALAIPDFVKMLPQETAGEPKWHLPQIFVSQTSYYGEHGVYAVSPGLFEKIRFEVETPNRYSYYCGDEVWPCHPNKCGETPHPTLGPDWPLPVKPYARDHSFMCMAVGNLDDDPTMDVWSINERKVLVHFVNDWKE